MPIKVLPNNLAKAILGIRALNIRGCGVSMPYKTEVGQYLDKIDPTAKKIGAINTIVNDNGILTGFNTDVSGALKALEKTYPIKGKAAHIIGSGGAARAIIVALQKSLCKKIILTDRNDRKAKDVSREFNIEYNLNKYCKEIKADLLVNATPVGMKSKKEEMIVQEKEIDHYKAIMDVVILPHYTKLINSAMKKGKIIIPGYEMAFYQAVEQFKLYTEKEAPINFMKKYMEKYFFGNKKS